MSKRILASEILNEWENEWRWHDWFAVYSGDCRIWVTDSAVGAVERVAKSMAESIAEGMDTNNYRIENIEAGKARDFFEECVSFVESRKDN